MTAWNPTSERDWAKQFGFVVVPLFGRRQSDQPGEHFMLLDGQRSSLTFSRGDSLSLLASRRPIKWAWSANVRGSILVDEKTKIVRRVNWDQPQDVREWRPSAVDELLEDMPTPPAPSVETSIDRAMRIFRSVRQDIHECGGNNLDAIHTFTVLLLLADSIQQGAMPTHVKMLGDAVTQLVQQGRLSIKSGDISPKISGLPIRGLADQLLSSDSLYSLDPYLLIRHASGTLFQEAHIALGKPCQTQGRLFLFLRDAPSRPRGKAPSDIHYTPPTLARFLTEQAVKEFRRLNANANSVRILDPAVGSGAFLVEAIRVLESTGIKMAITGIDSSSISVAMTRVVVNSALRDSSAAATASAEIINDDSLARQWNHPDIILMNPPFLPWRRIDNDTRTAVKQTLGDLFHGHGDTAIAFIAKAVRALKPGGVLATVLPAPLLGSDSASKLRSALSGPEWRISIVGRGRGYGYFAGATVEPAFVVIGRSSEQAACIRTVIAESSEIDRAIRAVRTVPPDKDARGPGWELGISSTLDAEDWNPRPARAKELLRRLAQNATIRAVTDLFDVHLGIRAGNKHVFVVPPSLVQQMEPTERRFFRPLADTIKYGRVQSSHFLFYPYDKGRLLITSETDLKNLVPMFYSHCLKPKKSRLQDQGRRQNRRWWALARARTDWLTFGDRRIVSAMFVGRGAFALDVVGEYAIRQGNAWIWRGSKALIEEEWFAYLAIFNSPIFEAVLDCFCPQVKGGQYDVSKRFMEHVPLPDVTRLTEQEKKELAEHGRAIHNGERVSLYPLNATAVAAFGVDLEEFTAAFPLTASARLEMDFEQLAGEWKAETGMLSRLDQKYAHPAYQQIIGMGEAAVPFILRDLKETRGHWFWALRAITCESPVPRKDADDLNKVIEAWLEWGRKKRYTV